MIDGSQFLKEFRSREPHLALLLEQMIDGINGTANLVGVNPNGKVAAPPPLEAIDVKANNGDVHVTLTHNAPINKNIKYFVEASTDPTFQNVDPAHVFELGSSRGLFTRLPAMDDDGNAQNWHFRAYPQYQGSDASEKTYFGTMINPTPVDPGGTTQLTPLPSKGSGTAAPNGSQGGQGLGTDLRRLPLGPKVPASLNAL
jgi:hypothetical protein